MKSVSIVFSIILAIFLVFSILVFVPSHAVTSNLGSEKIDSLIDDLIDKVIERDQGSSLEAVYQDALRECSGQGNVVLEYEGYGGIELDCSIVEDREAFDNLIKEKIKGEVDGQFSLDKIYQIISLVGIVMWVSLVLSITLIIMIVLFSGYKASLIIGVSGIVAGLPVLFLGNIQEAINRATSNLGLEGTGEINNIIQTGVVGRILDTLFRDFMLSLMIGIVLLIIGAIWILVRKKKGKKVKRKGVKKK